MPRTLLLVLLAGVAHAQAPISPAPDTWGAGTPMPTARKGPFTCVIGANVYVIGGETDSAAVAVNEIYDTTTNSWSTGAPMPTPRWLGGCAVVGDILYVIAGADFAGNPLTVVEAYNPATDTWSAKAHIPVASDSVNAIVENNIVYVIGGYDPSGGRLASVEAYNPATDSWSAAAPLKVGKSEPAIGLIGSTIVAAGGLANSGQTGDNEGYNAATNMWEALTPAPTTWQAGCFGESAGVLYLAGGQNSGLVSPDVQAYSLQTNSWTTGLAAMPNATFIPGSAVVGGALYCFGGSQTPAASSALFNYVQIYQPALAAPVIGGIVSASAFGGFSSASPGSWIEIYGSNLSGTTRGWTGADFTGSDAPTSLDGTSVTIGGQKAFIDYISSGQVNALIPSTVVTGAQQLTLTTSAGTSAAVTLTVNAVEPGLLAPVNFKIGGVQYAVALFGDGTYVLPTGAISGLTSRPAKAGDEIVLYGVGFGPVTPLIPAGQLVGEANSLADFKVFIGGVPCTVQYDGLAPNYTGLFQFNITVPDVDAGNQPLTFTLDGTPGAQGLYISVGN